MLAVLGRAGNQVSGGRRTWHPRPVAALLKVGIVGAGGYTGAELVRLIHAHPRLELVWVAARERAGQKLAEALPNTQGISGLGDMTLEAFDPKDAPQIAKRIDVAFTALPHGASVRVVTALFEAGVRVVDLSADFRLRDAETYTRWYGEHAMPGMLEKAVYGLPELHREQLHDARLIAAPGCYPTSAILPLAPLLRDGLVEPVGIIVDSKSGVSGAGRSPAPAYHLPEAAEGIRPYKIAGAHRHTPEIEQELSRQAKSEIVVVFTPQLAPMTRGILACTYARAKTGTTAERCREAARTLYAGGLVSVLDEGRLPDTLWVRGSARAHVAYALDERTKTVIGLCALDNLAKGASAQAVQALNVAMGWPDGLGLPEVGTFP
jgi:N-acetyl-gamma-glutamyl-phosphate reductase